MLHKENNVLNRIARIICFNTCTTTGANLRKIWLETGVNPHISSCKLVTTKLGYHTMPSHEKFKIDIIKELIDVKFGFKP